MKGLRPNETKSGQYHWYHQILFLLYKYYFLTVAVVIVFFLSLDTANAQQVCNGSLGDPIINQTFGTKGYRLPPNKTKYQFVNTCPNSMGTYTLSGFLFGCGPRSWVQMVGDHTPNDQDGNYMLVNASNSPGTVYADTAKNLCSNTVYQFGIWVTSVMNKFACNGNAILPNLKFTIKTLSGSILAEDSTGYLPIVEESKWKFYGLSLRTPNNVADAIISVTVAPPFGCGAAFAIDDITFSPCSPSVITATINGSVGPVDVCADYTDVWKLNVNYTPGFTDPVFQWQNSLDSGKTWIDIPGEITLSYTVPHRTSGTILYRACIAERGNINSVNCRITSNVIYTGVHPLPAPVPPLNVRGCIGKDFYFPASDPKALQVLWTGPNSYSSTGATALIPNIQYKDTGLYKLSETFYFGCTLIDTFYLNVFPGTTVSVQPVSPVCEGNSERLFASASDSAGYKWTPSTGLSSDNVSNPLATPFDSTQYKVVVTNKYGCKDSAYLQVNIFRKTVANAGPDKIIMAGDTTTLNGSVKGTSVEFFWTPSADISNTGIINPQVFPSETTFYTLNAVSAIGCGTVSDDVQVKVYKNIYIPNAFTPNDDGKNDKFRINIPDNYKLISLLLFNRWGQLVYKSTGSLDGWDGTFKGLPQPPEAYVYHLEIKTASGKKIIRKGTILLVR